MKNNRKAFIVALATTALLTAGAGRAAAQQTPAPQKSVPPQTSASKDFSKLSADGSKAFQDLTRARVAIFDGRTDDAKKYIQQAETAFDKAKTDEAVFTKAEADLKPPAGKNAPPNQTVGAAPPASKSADSKSVDQMKKPIAWLPVDGAFTINEDYTVNPAKKAAVAEADKSLKSGDRTGAMDKLKLADMNIDVTLAVVPLQQTIDNVHQATGLINDGKYYEASQLLRRVQDSERFDVTSITAKPSNK